MIARLAETMDRVVGRMGSISRTDDRTPSPDGSPLVDLDGITVRLGPLTAVDDVDLAVDRGRFVGLIGPNGAGKTTLLRTITGAISPDAGTVRVAGADVHSQPSRAVSREIAVVPQDTSIGFDFTVREIVAMGRTPYQRRVGDSDRAPETVDRAMARTGVDRFADRPISAVSGGERQRVLLARAIAQDTPILLLDEPTASLDITHQLRTLELARSLTTDGTTIIAAIHDLNLAARYCDELVLLDDGRRVAHGSPEQVLTTDTLRAVFDAETTITTHPVTGSIDVTPIAPAGPAEDGAETPSAPDDRSTERDR